MVASLNIDQKVLRLAFYESISSKVDTLVGIE